MFFLSKVYAQKSQGIGTNTPNPRSVLELNVEDAINFPQGFLFPRLTTAQRVALGTVSGLPAGMSVYDNSEKKFYVWDAPGWTAMGSGSGSQWTTSGANIFYTGGNVSIGTGTITSSRLSIQSLGNSSTTSALNIVNSTGNSILFMQDNGMMGINNTAPGYHLHVNGRIKSNGVNETSDVRLKTDIEKLTTVLEKVLLLQGVSYRMRNDECVMSNDINKSSHNLKTQNSKSRKEIGLIAQEVEKFFPELVDTDDKGYKSIEYSRVVALLIEAIKEQNREIQDSKLRVKNLKGEIEDLKAEWKAIKEDLFRTYPTKSEK